MFNRQKNYWAGVVLVLGLAIGATASACPFDIVGTTVFQPLVILSPDGQVTFGMVNWWEDDVMACYNGYLYPSVYPFVTGCDADSSGAIEAQEVLDIYWYVLNYPTGGVPAYAAPCAPGCPDADGDGVCDSDDLCPGKDDLADGDADGIPDCVDACVDTDADGVCDRWDVCPGVDNTLDQDGDAIPDCIDPCVDDDGDTVCNGADQCPGVDDLVFTQCTEPCVLDTDGDGTCDALDACPNDPGKVVPGACGCGVSDVDTDLDDVPDCLDPCPLDNPNFPLYPSPIPDEICGFPCDPADDFDSDGFDDCVDACPFNGTKTTDIGVCGCDENDEDEDADGIIDCVDPCHDDRDGDGVLDCDDICVDDPNKVIPGICGCDEVEDPTDGDGDGIWDCADTCPEHNPDDPDADGICGTAIDPCVGIGDKDGDHSCDPTDLCVGNDKYGDFDGDGYCDEVDECLGDDLVGDADGDFVCDDLDLCQGLDGVGDWDSDGICNDLDPDCSVPFTDPLFLDSDLDGVCDADDPCPITFFNDADVDGVCDVSDNCPAHVINDQQQDFDTLCALDDPCPWDRDNDADHDGLCADLDACLGTNATGDSDGDGVCDDWDMCQGNDLYGDADLDGICDEISCQPDIPAFYDPSGDPVAWTASGVCVEAQGISGPPACPMAEHTSITADMQWILANYDFTNAIYDSQVGVGQGFVKDPYRLSITNLPPKGANATMFDDLNSCYHGVTQWNAQMSGGHIDFGWGVNVWEAVIDYNARAALHGGTVVLDGYIGVPYGFRLDHQSGWRHWTVDATENCDILGCRCHGTVTVWSDGAGGLFLDSLTNNNKMLAFPGETPTGCTDPRFFF